MLPNLGPTSRGIMPLADGIFQPALEMFQRKAREAEGARPTAALTRLRGSEALMCSRAIGLRVLGVEESDPVPPEVLMAFEVGHDVHNVMQSVLVAEFQAEVEVVADWMPLFDMSAHADGVYSIDPDLETSPLCAVEIKSVAGYGFLLATGARKSDDGPGPKAEHLVQAGMAACAPNIQAQYVHIIYFDKDKNSIAEWILDVDMPLPRRYEELTIRQMVEAELTRQTGILGRLDDGKIPARHIPGWGRVGTPSQPGTRDDPWNCRYCRFNGHCTLMPSEPFPIEHLPELGVPIADVV